VQSLGPEDAAEHQEAAETRLDSGVETCCWTAAVVPAEAESPVLAVEENHSWYFTM